VVTHKKINENNIIFEIEPTLISKRLDEGTILYPRKPKKEIIIPI
tara:strand:- start:374 stop:508 length:135 start_codon:yes stop_codon:yes gene_type:complete